MRQRVERGDVEGWIAAEGGREQALQTARFFAYELERYDTEFLECLIAGFGDELESWAGLRQIVREREQQACH